MKKEWPKIMLALLTKNDSEFLPKFLKAMKNLDYPKNKLRWVWIYGRSVDNTLDIILKFHKKEKYKYEIYEEPLIERPVRSSLYIAGLCNLFKELYKGEDFVLLADTDVIEIPKNTLKEMVKLNLDIVAPYPYRREGNKLVFYDTYIFRWKGWKFEYLEMNGKVYNYRNPPFKDLKTPVELDSVGTFFLVKGEVFKKASWSNPAPHLQFCLSARKLGYKVYALPYLKVIHANLEKEEPHYPVEWYVSRKILPSSELEKVGYIKIGKKWILKPLVRKETKFEILEEKKELKEFLEELDEETFKKWYRFGREAKIALENILKEKSIILTVGKYKNKIISLAYLDKVDLRKGSSRFGIVVHPKFRNLGIATSHISYLLRLAREKKIERISLSVDSKEKYVFELYKKFGWKVVEFFKDNPTRCEMVLSLGGK